MSHWRSDLWINAQRTDLPGAVHAWFFCPGFKQVMLYRWSNRLRRGGRLSRFLSMVVWRQGVASFGCHISPMARIGHTCHLPHPTGIVVGEGTRIGDHAVIYQHVTLGVSGPTKPAYPTIGNRVMIYSGAVIVGGVSIGDDCIIGANSVVTKDIPAGTIAAGVPARVLGPAAQRTLPPRPGHHPNDPGSATAH